jgi:hypothetical protein
MFSEVFGDPSSEPAICQSGDLPNSEFIWDIPQLQAEENIYLGYSPASS